MSTLVSQIKKSDMKSKLIYLSSALLGLVACFSCKEKEKEMVSVIETTHVYDNSFVGLETLIPDLVIYEDIKYDEELGYYSSFRDEEWEHTLAMSAFIPAQSVPCTFKASQSASGWDADSAQQIVLSDICLPGGSSDSDLIHGECNSVFKMKLSLGENVPYRKVTLSDFEVTFPEWFRAKAESIDPKLEVTSEGTVVSFRLNSIQDPARFIDEKDRRCFSLDLSFHAHATVSPEDYIGPASENPSDLDFLCSVEFDRIDFTTCDLQFQEVYFSQDRVSYLGVLPGFFWGENADIRFTSPRLLIDYVNDFPYTSSRVDVVAFFEDEYDRQTVTFSLSDNGKYLYMPKADGIQREGIQTIEIGDMEKMLSSPLPNGALFARLLLQPVFSTSGTFVPEQEYLMSIKATWMLPLAFLGHPTMELETPALVIDSEELNTSSTHNYQIEQEISGDLPFDCRITPVFKMEGKEPVLLDDFPLDKNNKVKVTHQFSPNGKFWKASLHYIVTPTEGKNVFFMKEHGIHIDNSILSRCYQKVKE